MRFIGQFSIEPAGLVYFPMRGDDRTPYGYWQLNLNYWFKLIKVYTKKAPWNGGLDFINGSIIA
jgi:hypothetical protein